MAVDPADAGDQPVGRRALDQVVERAPPPLRGDGQRPVLDERAGVDRSSTFSRAVRWPCGAGAPPRRAARVGPSVVAVDDLGQVGADAIEVDRRRPPPRVP